MDSHLMRESVDLLLYGMGVVFIFLTVLVGTTSLMSHVVNRYFPQPVAEKNSRGSSATGSAVDATTLKVIQAAIDKHRRRP